MALTARVTPSFTWPNASLVTLARLRLTARPTVDLIGGVNTSQIEDGAITVPKLDASLQARFLNVKDAPYNAAGDGVTNDTPAFMLALADMKAAGGGVLRIPKGTYRLGATVDGYSLGQYEAAQNYALLIDFSNCVFEGDGMGLTILLADTTHTTLVLASGAIENIGMRGLTFQQGDAAGDYAVCATTLSRRGQDPLTATSYIDKGWTLATMVYFIGTSGDYMKNIFMTECEVKNPVRHGIAMAWVSSARFLNNNILYYDGFIPPEHSYNEVGAGRCGIFSGAERVNDIVVIGNTWNGNVTGNNYSMYAGFPLGTNYATYIAADGFLWFAKGGNVMCLGNEIRNYALEAVNFACAPAIVESNQFFTKVGTPSCVALLFSPNSPNDTDVDRNTCNFAGNTVVHYGSTIGLGGGLWNKARDYDNTLPCPRARIIASDNEFEDVGYPFAAIATDVFKCDSNVSINPVTFFISNWSPLDVTYPAIDFRNKYLSFTGNVISGCTQVSYLFQNPLKDNGVILIDGGIVSRGVYHAMFPDPSPGTTYQVLLGDAVFINYDGTEVSPVFNSPIHAGVKFVRHLGRFFHGASSPRTPAVGYRMGDVIRNTQRGKAGVLCWEAISESVSGAVFEPCFSAAKGVLAQNKIYALTAATPVELLQPLEGQSPRVFAISVINARNCTWAGANTVLRIRTKVASGTPSIIAQIPITKLIAATTLVAQADITYTQPVDDVGGMGGSMPVGAGIEVIGWNTSTNLAVNLATDAADLNGPVIIACYCQYEFATSV